MITIARSIISPKPTVGVQTALQHIYGIGSTRADYLIKSLSGRNDTTLKQLRRNHFRRLTQRLDDLNWKLYGSLRRLTRHNITRLKRLYCYRGRRHNNYLPVRGQRTRSNAMTARYLGSGTFEFVPSNPVSRLKRLSKYIRRKAHLRSSSEEKYRRLLNRSYRTFKKNNPRLVKYLDRKGKLGAFSGAAKNEKKLKKLKSQAAKILGLQSKGLKSPNLI